MVYIHRKVAFATMICGIKFLPGMNAISDGEMKLIDNHIRGKVIFKEECDCGNMMIGGSVQSETKNAAKPGTDIKERAANIAQEIASVNVGKAKELIEKIGDGYVLRALKEADGRRGIQDAVDKRITSIAAQEGSDLTPSSKPAPNGDGSDFLDNIGSNKEAQEGRKGHSAIPELNDDEIM